MKNIIRVALVAGSLLAAATLSAQKQFTLQSPDGHIEARIAVGQTIEYSVLHDGDVMLAPSQVSMTIAGGAQWGIGPSLTGSETNKLYTTINTAIYKRRTITDRYNELTLKFTGDYNIVFRAYDDGVAYRWVWTAKKPLVIENEQADFNFPADTRAFIPYVRIEKPNAVFEDQFYNSFENVYAHTLLSEWDRERLAFSPLVVEAAKGKKVCLAEADLLNYPGMYLFNETGGAALSGVFAPYPHEERQGGHNNLQMEVTGRETYIAKFDGAAEFPWRVVIVAANDSALADSDMVYKLASAPDPAVDYSWVKPGKVAWDWWNDWNLWGVDFEAGINDRTYIYYIEFAAQHGIEYVILDEGWAVNGEADLMKVEENIDLSFLVSYGKQRGVGLILWAGYKAFERDMEQVCRHYSEMGIKGFKVDFMDRDDQAMVDFHRRGAEMAAKYHLMIDYHGTYKPTGLQRTYPNVINFEGVFGLEQLKWNSEVDQVTYEVTMPFIRQVAGPVDYTQGAMRNSTRGNFRPVYNEAMSQGTRARQLAQYVVFESPLNMLCDSPSNYIQEAECLRYISSVPTVWDETRALGGEIGQWIAIARQKGDEWYIGAMTDWDARTVELDLSFLGKGDFKGEVFRDGANAGKAARDYKREEIDIPSNRRLTVNMAPGGGYVIRIYQEAIRVDRGYRVGSVR